MRAWLAGWKCVFVPEAVAYHKVSASRGTFSDFSVYYYARNIEWVWIKNVPLILMLRYLPHRFLYEVASFAYFCLIKREISALYEGKDRCDSRHSENAGQATPDSESDQIEQSPNHSGSSADFAISCHSTSKQFGLSTIVSMNKRIRIIKLIDRLIGPICVQLISPGKNAEILWKRREFSSSVRAASVMQFYSFLPFWQ